MDDFKQAILLLVVDFLFVIILLLVLTFVVPRLQQSSTINTGLRTV
uniref:5 kDa protein n=1 Tax=Grapevine leafroll-associated virus 3 TaxID=55951 RepID=A0A345T7Y1_9CLOS|nr:5 kDa protein [Grapevine leafroll-associated virus 3]QBZ78468.1 small hydrophobic protein [Grapevine leafroll-associated virus 3]UYT09223.1 small hydrophobic protein [Grapevine leafroll-associated virus 3]UYT09236.1 small hydrophobic protein [Grapevine leafroll-associated virus 3]WDS60492.1 small hydrophobic protein [Grapevine leafroll-associated virus 3]